MVPLMTMSEAAWTFGASVTSPNGITIRSEIQLPEELVGPDSLELTEVAQMGITRMASIMKGTLRSPRQAIVKATIYCGKSINGGDCYRSADHEGDCEEVPF